MKWKPVRPGKPNDAMPLPYCGLDDTGGQRTH